MVSPRFRLAPDAKVFTIGSCFARNIEEYLERAGVEVLSRQITFPRAELGASARPNDLLVKYTPGSIHVEVAMGLGASPLRAAKHDFVAAADQDGWFDPHLSASFPPVALERAIERRTQISRLFASIREADVLIITLGLVEHWRDRQSGLYINGMPRPSILKSHPDRFVPHRLGFSENLALIDRTLRLALAANPALRVILTVSPVPLAATYTAQDAILANTYSKSVLRAVAEEMTTRYDAVDYFPSYEMAMLSPAELTFVDDLRHVRETMVGQIMEAFFDAYMPAADNDAAGTALRFTASRATAAREALDDGRIDEAITCYGALLQDFPDDVSILVPYCHSALLGERRELADRLSKRLLELEPGDRAELLRSQALMLQGRHVEALSHARAARQHAASLYHAGGWEMEIGRLLGDRSIELSGALVAAEPICARKVSPSKKPWILRRTLRILQREGRSDLLREVKQAVAES